MKSTRLTTSLVVGTPIHDYYYGKNERSRGFAVQEALEIYFQIKTGQVQIVPAFSPHVMVPVAPMASLAPTTPVVGAPSEAPAPIAEVAPVTIPVPVVHEMPTSAKVVPVIKKKVAPAAPAKDVEPAVREEESTTVIDGQVAKQNLITGFRR